MQAREPHCKEGDHILFELSIARAPTSFVGTRRGAAIDSIVCLISAIGRITPLSIELEASRQGFRALRT